MAAFVLSKVPNAHIAPAVAADQFALVGMDDHVIYGTGVVVVTLDHTRLGVPYLDRAILGAGNHPFCVAVESQASDVVEMAFKSEHRIRIARFDLVEFDRMVASRSEKFLVRGDAQAIHLRVGMVDGPLADTGERFPEP